MKRLIILVLVSVLICACAKAPAEPVIEKDERSQQTPLATDKVSKPADDTTMEPVAAAPSAETETSEPVPADSVPEETFSQQVVRVWTEAGLLEGFAPYSELDLLDLYGIDLSLCYNGAGFADAVSYVNEAVVVEADEETAKQIEQLLKNHLDAIKEQFESYDADAYALADKAVLVRDGGIVLMIVSPDAKAMQDLVSQIHR